MKKFLVAITVMVIGIVGLVGYVLVQDGFDIKVKNQTNKEVSGLYLTYDNIKSDIKIPLIASGEIYKLNVNPTENSNKDFDEGAMKLQYKDNEGILHTEYVIGYFEKGYSGNAVITIKSIDDNGKLDIEIKENTSLY
ncbi:hypothetical protein [Bacillus multifaciens]|uniref:hypothetical protein n=1 Tax=Bacillus multifaciens TaxID=3068506 RepID=UPI002742753E|nr:hypothetical protein [Bacillus sp. WLY-B-L8]MDP7977407.1 hypothetical protein [Bacillus sp. WLY-B-L8]